MIINVTANDAGQRLDRFLKKYLRAAPLSLVYRLIRKDVKVNGAREGIDYALSEGDEIALYMDDARIDELVRRRGDKDGGSGESAIKRSFIRFKVCYEDDEVLVVSKPCGLLTHGDEKERKNTLAAQVVAYLLDKGEYVPGRERVFTPSPVHRLDRNTSGLVVFGKSAKAIRDFNRMMAGPDCVMKYYMTLVKGEVKGELQIEGGILKNESRNLVDISDEGKPSLTIINPVETFNVAPRAGRAGKESSARKAAGRGRSASGDARGEIYTLLLARLVTGRPHQIRAHLAAAGYPVVGDPKYGDASVNKMFERGCGLKAQFLHAKRIDIARGMGCLEYLTGTVVESPLTERLERVLEFLRS